MYSIKSKNIKSIQNHAEAKARYESIKPLRGRVSDVRPLGPRRYTYIRIERINQKEADQRTQQAGSAVTYDRPRAGYLNQVYDRNKGWIDPALTVGAGLLGGPAAAAAAGMLVVPKSRSKSSADASPSGASWIHQSRSVP